jgi:ferredoxin-NADP reductase/ferredoxin/truncated hemoglobin YjbI
MTRVTFEGARYPLQSGESVLDALIRGGAPVQFSCRRGACHTCILRASEGEPGTASQSGLSREKREHGYFLPCKAVPAADLVVERPSLRDLFVRARVERKRVLSERVVQLLLEPLENSTFRAGQFFNLRAQGIVRSYSVASVQEEDYFIELHVQRVPGGALSSYLCDELQADDEVEIQGPNGSSTYAAEAPERPLLLLGTGSGLAPLWGVVRDALRSQHRGPIHLYHGARDAQGLYLQRELRELERRHENFAYMPCLSGPPVDALAGHLARGRVTHVAFERHPELADTEVFLAGSPSMVHEARYRATFAGAERGRIHADPFQSSAPYMPDDRAKLAALPPDPELWQALESGPGLTRILTDFYERVYEDPRLAPFFHNVTKDRAIQKQYEFLREVFARDLTFFGLRPFNAHHWMVISDELFDYRERLIESCMRRHGLAEHLIRRWLALHEAFRRELVKSETRGLIVDGIERRSEGYSAETLTVGSVCDGCQAEMPSGSHGRMHRRTGKLFCEQCAAREVGKTLPPAAEAER